MARSCNRLMIGKAYWKSLGLSTVLYATEITESTETDLKQLQIVDNYVYRAILQTPKYAAISALRSEVGASSAIDRDVKTKILFAKHLLEENRNELCRNIFLKELESDDTK